MTSYRLRFWNLPPAVLVPVIKNRRAWLLTVYGFETAAAVAMFVSITRRRAWLLTVYGFETCSFERGFVLCQRRAWLLTVYGFETLFYTCLRPSRWRRAWLLTVFGFETSFDDLECDTADRVSCMTSYRLRFCNHDYNLLGITENNIRSCMTSYRLRFWNQTFVVRVT